MKASTRTKKHIAWAMEKQEQCRNIAKTYPNDLLFWSEMIDLLQKMIERDVKWAEYCKELEEKKRKNKFASIAEVV